MLRLLILILFVAASCEEKKSKSNRVIDGVSEEVWKQRYVDSVMDNIKKDITVSLSDTTGIYKAPVQVTRARLTKKEYSNYKDVQLTYKNVSGKKISAIRFQWYGIDAFGEPADLGSYSTDGMGGGFDDDPLSPGRSTTSTWSVLSSRGKKILKAWAYEVAFEDGSKWKFKPGE